MSATFPELRRAAAALQSGAFRGEDDLPSMPLRANRPMASTQCVNLIDGQIVTVLGAVPGVGASSFALALGEAIGDAVRVLECSAPSALAAATTSELGRDENGWASGRRDLDGSQVLVQRAPRGGDLPIPALQDHDHQVTVLDPGMRVVDSGWVQAASTASLAQVIVAEATVRGIEALERALNQVQTDLVICAVRGPKVRRWDKAVHAASGRGVRELLETGFVIDLPHVPAFHVLGPTPAPFPPQIKAAAAWAVELLSSAALVQNSSTPGEAASLSFFEPPSHQTPLA